MKRTNRNIRGENENLSDIEQINLLLINICFVSFSGNGALFYPNVSIF